MKTIKMSFLDKSIHLSFKINWHFVVVNMLNILLHSH